VLRALGATAGDKAAGVVLLLFGLAALAPACYGAAIFTSRFRAHWPALRRWGGVGLFYAAILVLAATGIAARSEGLFALGGALFAPLAGVITADSIVSRGRWAGVRPGWRVSGVAAWAIGAAVGLLPVLGAAAGLTRLASIQPASLFAYLAAAIVFGATARRPASADGFGDGG
jgi:hypothetical protein